MKFLFCILLIIFLLSQPIFSDEDSDSSLCGAKSSDDYDCSSVEFSTQEYKCCLFESIVNEDVTGKQCELVREGEFSSMMTDKYMALNKEVDGMGFAYDNSYEDRGIQITCEQKIEKYEIKYNEEDKRIIESEEHCPIFEEAQTPNNCINKKLTQSAKNAGFDCGYYTLIHGENTANICFLINTDIIKTKKLYEGIKERLFSDIKEIVFGNNIIVKFNGDRVEIIENQANHNKSNTLRNRFILLIALLVISL